MRPRCSSEASTAGAGQRSTVPCPSWPAGTQPGQRAGEETARGVAMRSCGQAARTMVAGAPSEHLPRKRVSKSGRGGAGRGGARGGRTAPPPTTGGTSVTAALCQLPQLTCSTTSFCSDREPRQGGRAGHGSLRTRTHARTFSACTSFGELWLRQSPCPARNHCLVSGRPWRAQTQAATPTHLA